MTTWGSVNAENMYRIAVGMAGFDASELMIEIARRTRSRPGTKTNERTVLNAMDAVQARYP